MTSTSGVPAGPIDRAADDLLGCVVAAHGVDGHAWSIEMALFCAAVETVDVHVGGPSDAMFDVGDASGLCSGVDSLADLHRLAAAIPPQLGG